MNNSFDKKTRIKCVNLERRPDRKESVTNLLISVDLFQYCDFIKATDGEQLKPTDEIRYLFRNNDFQNRRGVIGCALSHYYLWQDLINDENYENYLILEDDITFYNNPKKELSNLFEILNKKNNWDIIHLGHHLLPSFKEFFSHQRKLSIVDCMGGQIGYYLFGSFGVCGTFGYIISKSGAKKMLAAIEKYGIRCAIDRIAYLYHKEMNIIQYQTIPHLVYSDYVATNNGVNNGVDSDIQYNHNYLF